MITRLSALLAVLSLLVVGPNVSCNNSESAVRGVDAVHTTADGRELWAAWLRQNAETRQPALLLLHQPGAGRDRHDFDEIFDALEDAGFNLLVPDLRSHGRSDQAGSVDELATDPAGYPVDVEAWVSFLVNRAAEGDAVDPDRIGIIGLGTSANLAAAAVGHGLAHCAVAVSPDLTEFNALQAGFDDGAVGDDDDSAAGDDDDSAADETVEGDVALHSIRWMHGSTDEAAATSAATLHAATADPKDLHSVAGGAHGVEILWESAENKNAIIEWCGANL